jgi:sulfopyruvate decarboxylase TPP-binding subunit
MDADLLTAEDDKIELKGSSIIAALKASGVEFILSVPDIVTSGGLLRHISRDPAFKLIRVCKEDECIGIASGLSYCDKRALTLIQSTGFLDSINAIRGIAVEFRQGMTPPQRRATRRAMACASSSRSSTPWASRTT